jgi:hypothetical protein
MRKYTLMALAAAMVASLGAFAIGQANASKPTSYDTAVAAAHAKEARIVAQLKLSAEQKAKYDVLQEKLQAETKAMHAMKSGHMERGVEINQRLHAGLKKIFTPTQYADYNRLWSQGDSGGRFAFPGPPRDTVKHNATVVGDRSPQLVSDDEVLRRSGASELQIEKVHNLYAELEAGRSELKALWQTGDDDAIWKKSMDLNKEFKAGIQKILTPAQYTEYKRIWDELLGPALQRGKGIKVRFVKPEEKPPSSATSGSSQMAKKGGK